MSSAARKARRIRALAICGSARRNGNTAFLMRQVLAGARRAGATAELVFAPELKMQGCLGCDGCKAPGATECVVDDDMQALYRKLKKADLWVLGTPVYFSHVSGQLKQVIDRFYAFFSWDGRYHLRLTGRRRGIAVVVQEAKSDEEARRIAGLLQKLMTACGAQVVGCVVGARLREPGAAKSRQDLIQAAQALGESAAAALREQA